MSTKIMECSKCESRELTHIDPNVLTATSRITVKVKMKCDVCGHEFISTMLSDYGKEQKAIGRIW